MTNKLKIFIRIMIAILPLALSGCITVNTSITVQPDGTGKIITSIGFPIELVGRMTEQGIDPVKGLKQFLFQDLGHRTRFEPSVDSLHEWLTMTRSFKSVDELSDLLNNQEFFESFSLQRNRGFLKDQFVLDAQLAMDNFSNPFQSQMSEGEGISPMAGSQPLDFQVTIQLPGKIIGTNGTQDNTQKTITWTANSTDTISLEATSESSNMVSIIVAVVLSILGILLVIAIIVLVMRSRRKSKVPVEDVSVQQRLVESVQPVDEEEPLIPEPEMEEFTPPSKILAMIGARQLLDQVNQHVLHNRGEISVGKGALRLVWTDQANTSVTRGIMITVKDSENIMINGVPFPATREAAREGLISCLKGMTEQ